MWGVASKIESADFGVDFGRKSSGAAEAPSDRTLFPKQIIVMGGPASGKGTQCSVLAKKHGMVHLSTGDMLREAVSSGACSDNGEEAPHIATIKSFMSQGKLIPDEIMVSLVIDRLRSPDCASRGWILDGFPRTANQARALLDAGFLPDAFVFLNVPDDVLIKRVVGRRLDPLTKTVYHVEWNPPPTDEIRQRLVVRSDDTMESMKQRVKQFRANADAVKGSYDRIIEVDGLGTPDDVSTDIESSLKQLAAERRQRV